MKLTTIYSYKLQLKNIEVPLELVNHKIKEGFEKLKATNIYISDNHDKLNFKIDFKRFVKGLFVSGNILNYIDDVELTFLKNDDRLEIGAKLNFRRILIIWTTGIFILLPAIFFIQGKLTTWRHCFILMSTLIVGWLFFCLLLSFVIRLHFSQLIKKSLE